ncbi:MAG: helix-turn-helix transcriptional regulator [Fimbriimonadaceae bacterium]|nr:helix-turn-helix transcriptional regulator [Fimbriimonadaceae bacterium]QYK57685.1 MAG: helix-turn-helix transcriptional regulator [Fimbriimonadaceae bacterium]
MANPLGARISRREGSILDLASNGKTDKQIASELGLSIGTIRTYWGRIRVKFSALTRAQAVGIYIRQRSAPQAPVQMASKSSVTGPLMACLAQEWAAAAWHVDPRTRTMRPLTHDSVTWLKDRHLGPQPPGTCWSRAFGDPVNATAADFEERLMMRECHAGWHPAPAPGVEGLFMVRSGEADGGYYVLVVPKSPA